MKIGYVGSGAAADAMVRRLSDSYDVVRVDHGHADGATPTGTGENR